MFSFFDGRRWDDPDWRVRERTALSSTNQSRLLQLALHDVAEEVRLAAVKGLVGEPRLSEVVTQGACEASRRLALARVVDPERRLAFVLNYDLPPWLRLLALESAKLDDRLLRAYRAEDPPELKIALLRLTSDDVLRAEVARGEMEPSVRRVAIELLDNEAVRTELALLESDAAWRRLLAEGVTQSEHLRVLLAHETEESMRVWLTSRMSDQEDLAQLAREDENLDVRMAALGNLTDSAVLLELACSAQQERVCLAALAKLTDSSQCEVVALTSTHENVRFEAVQQINSEASLTRLNQEATLPEIRWLAGRKLGLVPVAEAGEVRRPRTICRLIRRETVPDIAAWLVARVSDTPTLEDLAGAPQSEVAAAAKLRLREGVGTAGLRLMPVPGRPYELSVFPVTWGQLRAVLGNDVGPANKDDWPATGVSPETANAFCAKLTEREERAYRLPSFEEWRHACMTDREAWLDEAPQQPSPAEAVLHTLRLPLRTTGTRPIWRAWPNPWGLLDMVGNVVVWVEDAPRYLARSLLAADPLATGGDPSRPPDFAVAAGACWADAQFRKGRIERWVARTALSG